MRAYGVFIVFLFSQVLSVTVNRRTHTIVADTKEQLSPITIQCGLNDMVILSAPIVNHNVTIFQLTQPNGHTRNLQLSLTEDSLIPDSDENSLVIKYNKRKHRVITLLNNYKLFNVNIGGGGSDDVYVNQMYKFKPNNFMIGPFSEEDHGNWVLSLFARENGKWLEMFQVISVTISEYVRPKDKYKVLKRGETFYFGFAYPINYLESCEFTAPKTTYDRWYDRDQNNLDSCMFVVKNVTKEDEGPWTVVGVGRIVYATKTFLNVN